MMDKIASDAYSQGALEALQQMNVPHAVKQAAAQQIIKEASMKQKFMDAASRVEDAFSRRGGFPALYGAVKNAPAGGRMAAIKAEAEALKDLGIAGGLTGAGVIGTGALGSALMSDDEPEPGFFESLSPAEQAALIAGGTAGVAGAGYGLSQLM